jgi:hypothetical protein
VNTMNKAAENLEETDPEALTLFGRKPRKPCNCWGCGHSAEPYRGSYCWACCARGVPMPGGKFVPVEEAYKSRAAYRA